jgi:release factor glutamine methyltransferase
LLLEHGAAQSAPLATLLQAAGWTESKIYRDAAGIERVSGGRRPVERRG